MKEIYFAFWAGMLEWPIYKRAMLVLLGVMVLLWLLLILIKLLLSVFCKTLGRLFVRIYFVCRQNVAVNRHQMEQQDQRIKWMNHITSQCNSLEDKINKIERLLLNGNIKLLIVCIVAYVVCICLICLPETLGKVINESYIEKLCFAQDIYCSIEKSTVDHAENYQPLFVMDEEGEEYDEEYVSEMEECIWYVLSEKGKDGANLRLGPGKEYEVVRVLSGEVRMAYIDETDKWICVKLQDEQEGWISKVLVEAE